MNTVIDVVRAKDGQALAVREIVILLGNDLMRTEGLRVVSAWRLLPMIGVQTQDLHAYDQFCAELQASVRKDIGAERADAGFDAYWTYAPYVELCRSFGEQWPVEALAAYLRLFEGSEHLAQHVWERAVLRYDCYKVADGNPERMAA
ncbi:hypothetical protein CLM74_06140 [Stenotrophomonas sp. MYb57]|uniref:hypothetical protein n=1 Tax=Stenotrophomonas sp. MYb57 TaxID=1827305 RepID=UPI000CF60B1A|nr:hypothetical protein [Stenotrophomonas sp. MYb57]AVJ32387.1 hypothetical protein CLM74_06140 [Stenotrophomonas sp. MYb57]